MTLWRLLGLCNLLVSGPFNWGKPAICRVMSPIQVDTVSSLSVPVATHAAESQALSAAPEGSGNATPGYLPKPLPSLQDSFVPRPSPNGSKVPKYGLCRVSIIGP